MPSDLRLAVLLLGLFAAVTWAVIPREAPRLVVAPPARDARPLDLNAASAEELARLPGLGPERARRIVRLRRQRGGFRSVDELADVEGIGPRTLEKLRARVMVSP